MEKKYIKNRFKAKIIIILDTGEVISGDGSINAIRISDGKDIHFVAEFTNPFPTRE